MQIILTGSTFIKVHLPHPCENQSERNNELKETSPFFKHSIIADSVTNKYAREYGATIFSFSGAKIDIRPRLQEEINKVKAR